MSKKTQKETCSIKFGELQIVMNSVNSVPNVETFYENVPISPKRKFTKQIITPFSEPLSKIEQEKSRVKKKSQPCNVKSNGFDFLTRLVPSPNGIVFCWWCRIYQTDYETSCFVPLKKDELRNRYQGAGVLCSWECAKAFNFEDRDSKTCYRNYLIYDICKNMYGIDRARKIKYAPHWTSLVIYGGSTSVQDFLKFERTFNLKKRTDLLLT